MLRRRLGEMGVVRRIAGELWRHTVPVIGSNVLALMLSFAELYYAGLLGRPALFGVVVAATWTGFVSALALVSFTSGVTREITMGKGLGRDVIGPGWTALLLGVSAGVTVGAGCSLVAAPLLGAMRLGGESLHHGVTYLRTMSAAFPALFVVGAFQGVTRGLGEPGVAHRVLAVGILSSLALSPALAFGLDLGVAGLGIGNVMGLTVAAVAGVALIVRRWRLSAHWPTARMDWHVVVRIGSVTAPSAAVWLGVSVTIALLQRTMSTLGADFLVAFNVVVRLEPIVGMVASAFAAAALHVVGTYYAAGQVCRALLALRVQQWLFVATIAPLIGVLETWPRAWAGLFTSVPNVLSIADLNTRYFLLALPFIGIAQVVSASFCVFGRPTVGLRIFMVKNFVLLVPALFVTVRYLDIHQPHVIFLIQLAAAPCAWLYSEALLRLWRAAPLPAAAW